MALPQTPILKKDGKITIRDGGSGGAQKEYEVIYEDGNFKTTGLKHNGANTQVFVDRTIPYGMRQTDLIEIQFSFSAHAIMFTDADATLRDVALGEGAWSGAVSTLPAAQGDAYLLEVEIQVERTAFGATSDGTMTMLYCDLTVDYEEGDPGLFSISGRAIMFGGYENAVTWG